MLFEKKCCYAGYTVLALLYILLNDAIKVTYYYMDPLKLLVYIAMKMIFKCSWVQHRFNECLLIFGLHLGIHLQIFGLAQGSVAVPGFCCRGGLAGGPGPIGVNVVG